MRKEYQKWYKHNVGTIPEIIQNKHIAEKPPEVMQTQCRKKPRRNTNTFFPHCVGITSSIDPALCLYYFYYCSRIVFVLYIVLIPHCVCITSSIVPALCLYYFWVFFCIVFALLLGVFLQCVCFVLFLVLFPHCVCISNTNIMRDQY
jgi:hypothetical protein